MLRMHNLHGTKPPPSEGSDEEEEEEDEEEEEERKPQLELAMVPHYGGINRVRVDTDPGACSILSDLQPQPPCPCLPAFRKVSGTYLYMHRLMYVLAAVVIVAMC